MGIEVRAKVSVPVVSRTRLGSAGAQVLAVLDDDPTFDLVVVGPRANREPQGAAWLGGGEGRASREMPVLVARTRS